MQTPGEVAAGTGWSIAEILARFPPGGTFRRFFPSTATIVHASDGTQDVGPRVGPRKRRVVPPDGNPSLAHAATTTVTTSP
jgi:hypothetical protein